MIEVIRVGSFQMFGNIPGMREPLSANNTMMFEVKFRVEARGGSIQESLSICQFGALSERDVHMKISPPLERG